MKSSGEDLSRTWKNPILWHVEQLHLRIRTVLLEPPGGFAWITGGSVRYTMYRVAPQWQEPWYGRRPVVAETLGDVRGTVL